MTRVLSSLYGRLSAIFLVLLLIFAGVQLWVAVESARDFARESDQSLNRHLASDLAATFQPRLRDGLDKDVMGHLIHDMMVYNPRVEIYLLDAEGTIVSYSPPDKTLGRMAVDMGPIQAFLADSPPPLPILGDDPRYAGRHKPFSVAPITIGEEPGYLYLILGGAEYDSAAAMVEESYILRNAVVALAVTLGLIGVAGLLSFFLLTKRLRAMAGTVRAFEHGDQTARIADRQPDEIGQLGRAFNDLADRVVANLAALEQQETLRQELLANVSHDLRSPLASIQGYLESLLIKGERLPPEQRRQFLEISHSAVTRLNALMQDLFELSRLEADDVPLEKEPFSLAELAQDVVLDFQPMAREKRIALSFDPPPQLPLVAGDLRLIERVFTNLLDNALQHTPSHGAIELRLTPQDGGVRVSLSDTGPGIPPEEQERIFERFYRVDKSRNRASGGSGIGLAIVRRILDAHGTRIHVQSQPGHGATFTFTLPAADAPSRFE